jgi:hypothetical protein
MRGIAQYQNAIALDQNAIAQDQNAIALDELVKSWAHACCMA